MPRLSLWFVRASLIYFLLGFTIGALILSQKGVMFLPSIWLIFPLHMEFLLIGWFAQLALGVAFWILPRFSRGPSRGDERLAWLSFGLINAGLLAAVLQVWFPPAILAGRILEAAAGLLFVFGSWRRVKPQGG